MKRKGYFMSLFKFIGMKHDSNDYEYDCRKKERLTITPEHKKFTSSKKYNLLERTSAYDVK